MLMGLDLLQLETVRLLGKGSQLSHPLLGGNELGGHIPVQPRLFGEVILVFLLLAKEPVFLPAASDKGLKTMVVRTQKYMKKEEARDKIKRIPSQWE